MSDAEAESVTAMLKSLPQDMLEEIVAHIQLLYAKAAANQEDVPNAETAAAMQEVNEMIRTGSGQHFDGSTEDFFAVLDMEDDEDA